MKRKTLDEARTLITEAMRRLPRPRWADQHPNIEWEHDQIGWFAEEYLALPMRNSGEGDDSADRAIALKIKRETQELVDSMRLCKSNTLVSTFHVASAHSSLSSERRPTFGEMQRWLEALYEAADHASAQPLKRGNRKSPEFPGRIADLAAAHYQRITGEKPTRINDSGDGKTKPSGSYYDFVAAIYAALNITASVDNNAKSAISRLRARNRKFDEARTFDERFPDAKRIKIMEAKAAPLSDLKP